MRATILQGFNFEKVKYIATSDTIAVATDVTRISVYNLTVFWQSNTIFIPILFGIAIAGSFIGRKILKRINQDLFRKMVLVAIILVSIKFIVDGLLAY